MKILLTMKLTFLLLFVALLQVSAGSFAQKISLSENDARLESVLKKIRTQSGYNFLYNTQMLEKAERVTVHLKDASLEEAMAAVFKKQPFTYTIANKTIVVKKKRTKKKALEPAPVFTPVQDREIRGSVTDTSGVPLPGATVHVKGTDRVTSTDLNGAFAIEAGEADILEVSFIGYLSREIPVGGRSTIHIQLKTDVAGLDEVVVVGYGTQRRTDITGSVASVSEETIQSRPVASFQDALQGRASGVRVRQSGGDLDGKFSIAIRGVGSVTGSNDPLIVVDNVPLFSTDFSTINPKDIVSMDILKDASATAIYGSRAANGVIIITTRKGRAGNTTFTFNSDVGFEEITQMYDVMSTEQQRLLFVEAFKNSNRDISVYEDRSHPAWQIDTDWQDLGTRTALRQNYNLGFSGGSEKTQFAGSVSYLDREGTLINSDLKSWSLRVNVNSRINDWLKLSTNLTGSHQRQNVLQSDSWSSDGFRGLAFQHSFTEPYDDEGNLTAVNTTAAPYFGANANPLVEILLPTRKNQTTRILGNIKMDVDLAKGLVLSGNIGGDIVLGDNYIFLPVYEIGRYRRDEGSVTVPTSQQLNWISDLTLNYDRRINEHGIKVLAGFSAQQFLSKSTRTTGTGTVDNALNQLSNQTNFNASGSEVSAGLVSSFFRVNYDYDNKYLLTATLRRDGSSKFGPDKRYGIFPSGSVAWRISREDFLKSSGLINDLKLRLSYGLTGNQNIGNFAFITRAGAAPYVYGNSVVVGNAPQNIGNPDLQWEASKQFDIGIDVSLLGGRFHATLDYYDKQSEDLLVSTPIPLTAGVSQDPIVNLGSVKNTGFEFALTSRNLTGKLSWTTNFNISFNKNRVLDIGTNSIGDPLEIPGENIPLSNQATNLTKAGHTAAAFYMYKYIGVWQLGEEAEALKWSGAVPGDPRYADLNGNGVFDVGDKTFVGNPHPEFYGGLNNTFTYGNFSLSVFLDYATGYQVYNTARNLFSRGVPFVQNFAEMADFWTPENPGNTIPRPSQGGNTTTLATMVSSRFLENADFLRIKDIRITYDFPSSMLRDKIVKSMRLTLSGSNLVTFTEYTGLDPEASSRTSLLSAGIDYTPYPKSRLISLGVVATF